MRLRPALLAFASLLVPLATGCADAPVGTAERPFTMYFVPSVDAETIAVSADAIAEHVSKSVSQELYGTDEGFHVESAIPASYVAVVEAFGTGRADFAAITTFGYLLAKDEKGYDVKPLVTILRGDGETHYKGQILVRADSGIESLDDLSGKKFAFTDPSSTAGYVLPSHLLNKEDVKVGEAVYAMKHDNVVTQVYQGQVDAGATYWSKPVTEADGTVRIRDARARVKTQFPDVEERVKILTLTDETPNEPWVIRGNLYEDAEMQRKVEDAVRNALMAFAETEEGKDSLEELYNISGLAQVDDSIYDGIREIVAATHIDLESAIAD